jgi:hypothetical protein
MMVRVAMRIGSHSVLRPLNGPIADAERQMENAGIRNHHARNCQGHANGGIDDPQNLGGQRQPHKDEANDDAGNADKGRLPRVGQNVHVTPLNDDAHNASQDAKQVAAKKDDKSEKATAKSRAEAHQRQEKNLGPAPLQQLRFPDVGVPPVGAEEGSKN